jgi:AcrR family transcriptional regulator
MSLRERHKADKLARIKAAAWELFADQGYEATTTRAICARAGIGTGTLFSYVDDKTDLLVMLFVDRFSGLMEESFTDLPQADISAQFAAVFSPFFDFYARDMRLSRQILRAILVLEGRPRERLAGLQLEFQLRCTALVTAAIARGELRASADPYLAAASIFGLYLAALTAFLNGYAPDRPSLDALFHSALAQLVQGLTPEER